MSETSSWTWRNVFQALSFVSMTVITSTALIALMGPATCLFCIYRTLIALNVAPRWATWFHRAFRLCTRAMERAFGSFVVFLLWLYTPGTRFILTGEHEKMKDPQRLIAIANHQIYPDWLYLWTLAWHQNKHGDVKILLMAILKYIPILGLGMLFFEFIFLKRKWELDRPKISKHLQRTVSDNLPLWLLIFPEVNRFHVKIIWRPI
jgi:1-acyl-sn-glycerol-3-phosphate acyltransferase